MNMRAGVSVLVVVVLTGAFAIGLVGSAVANPTQDVEQITDVAFQEERATGLTAAVETQEEDFDRSIIELTVHEDGSATWTFRYERTLTDEEERADFQEFADRFREEETELYENFQSDSRALVAGGADLTGREMTASEFERDADIRTQLDNDIGYVEMRFVWTNFAERDDDSERLVIGDVFEGGLYLGSDQILVIKPGADLAFESVDPNGTQSDPDSLAKSTSVTYEGDRQFTDRRPRAVFVPESAVGAPGEGTPTPSPGPGGAAGPGDIGPGDAGSGVLGILFGSVVGWMVIGLVVLAAGGVAWRRGLLDSVLDRVGPAGADGARGASGATGTAGADANSRKTSEAEFGPVPSVPEPEYASDEDRVTAMLEDHGGRMKQSQIVEATEWSKSKVSVLLSEMEADGTVSKLRVGRENVVSLDGHEPEATRSPFDEE